MNDGKQQSGLTLVEVLITMVLLTVLLVPAIQALQTSVTGANVHSEIAVDQSRLTTRMEELLAEPFGDLEAAAVAAGGPGVSTSYSDPSGPAGRLIVYLSPYDGDNADVDDDPFSGTDDGLLWIRVEVEDTTLSLQTLRAQGY